MKRILLAFVAISIALAPACKKEDDNSNNNNNGGGGGTTPPPLDVWSLGMATYTGDGANGVNEIKSKKVVVTKISNTKIKIAGGPAHLSFPAQEIDIMTNDTAIFQPPGSQSSTGIIIEINCKAKPITLLYSNTVDQVSYFGIKD